MTSVEVFDIEGDNLYDEVKNLWCSSHIDLWDDNNRFTTRPETIGQLAERLLEARDSGTIIVGHNIIDYDIPAIEKLLNIDLTGLKIIDTLIFSRTIYPDRKGGHALKAWGIRLGILKGDFGEKDIDEGEESVWDRFTEDMLTYCIQDTVVTKALLIHLMGLVKIPLEEIETICIVYEKFK